MNLLTVIGRRDYTGKTVTRRQHLQSVSLHFYIKHLRTWNNLCENKRTILRENDILMRTVLCFNAGQFDQNHRLRATLITVLKYEQRKNDLRLRKRSRIMCKNV